VNTLIEEWCIERLTAQGWGETINSQVMIYTNLESLTVKGSKIARNGVFFYGSANLEAYKILSQSGII